MSFRGRVLGRVAAVAAVAVALGACSSTSSANGSGAPTVPEVTSPPTTLSPADVAAAATDSMTKGFAGTNRPVDPTPRPAVKGKKVVVISAGMAVDSNKVPTDAAVAAGRALGWKMSVSDAGLQTSKYPDLVNQAIASQVDGIILDAIDCGPIKSPLEQAKAAHIVVTSMYAFDCNDAHVASTSGGAGPALFSGNTNFGKANADLAAFTESYGVEQANYIIATSHNTAKIIVLQDPEFTVLYYTLQGFKKTIEASNGSKIVDTLNFTANDILTQQLAPKVHDELAKYPDATWIKSPFTFATVFGIKPSLSAHTGHIDVMGGEGFKEELDLIKAGTLTAVNIISSEWTGWAAADTLNSLFAKQPPVDSGIGFTLVDKDHGLPSGPDFVPSVDFKSSYKKAWGVG